MSATVTATTYFEDKVTMPQLRIGAITNVKRDINWCGRETAIGSKFPDLQNSQVTEQLKGIVGGRCSDSRTN